jgi:hypothetical protein
MKHFLSVLLMIGGLGACASHSEDGAIKPYQKIFEEDDRQPAKSAGWCTHCNMQVYEGHRCKLTHPCQLCQREAGARHLHEVQWTCDRDSLVISRQHECLDAKTCWTCRQDKRALLGTIGCERCYSQIPVTALHGITSYCAVCNLEVGANHIHGKTVYCLVCLREAGEGHVHDATRLCMDHQREEAPDHIHGTTQYCLECHRDCGVGHKHGQTEWCWLCMSEMPWPHHHHS